MINFAVGKAFTRNKSSDFKCDNNTGWSSSPQVYVFDLIHISFSNTRDGVILNLDLTFG